MGSVRQGIDRVPRGAVADGIEPGLDHVARLAYYNDPTDVMNAIQVMRQRAQTSGHLRSGGQMRVTQVAQAAPTGYTPATDAPVVYAGPAIVPPPRRRSRSNRHSPTSSMSRRTTRRSSTASRFRPTPATCTGPFIQHGEVVTAGVITFGIGIAVGAAIFGHHDWGWHAWGMNWGAPRPEGPRWNGGWERPAVVYNHTTYVSKSTTVINNITNIRNTRITNNYGGNVTNNTTNTTIERNTMQPGAGFHARAGHGATPWRRADDDAALRRERRAPRRAPVAWRVRTEPCERTACRGTGATCA